MITEISGIMMVMGDFEGFISQEVPIMVLDKLYANGTFKPLTEKERVTANLIMFSDVLPLENYRVMN